MVEQWGVEGSHSGGGYPPSAPARSPRNHHHHHNNNNNNNNNASKGILRQNPQASAPRRIAYSVMASPPPKGSLVPEMEGYEPREYVRVTEANSHTPAPALPASGRITVGGSGRDTEPGRNAVRGRRGSLGDDEMKTQTGDKGKDIMRNNMISYRAQHPEGTFNQVSLAHAIIKPCLFIPSDFAIVYRSNS